MQKRSQTFLIGALLMGAAVVAATGLAFGSAPAVGAGGASQAAGDLPEIIGGPGASMGRFFRPRGITSDSQGRIFNVDQMGRLQVFDADAKPLREWSMPDVAVGKPEGLAIDLDGNLLVADTHYSRVLRFNPRGDALGQWGVYGVAPGQFTYPLAVAVDRGSGRIYVSEYGQNNDRVQYFNRDGEFLGQWGGFGVEQGQFRRPSGLAIGPEGAIYVADSVNHRIQVFTPEGKFLRMFGQFGAKPGDLAFPYDVAVTPDGTVFVCEFGNNRVQALTATGASLGTVGETGSAPGQLATPWCMTLEPLTRAGQATEWRVVVADTLNHRLCRWRVDQIVKNGAVAGQPAAVKQGERPKGSHAGAAGVAGGQG